MILPLILCVIFSILSTAMLSYISMAVMIGPWVHSIIILVSSLLLAPIAKRFIGNHRTQSIALITAGASIGGILATGFGFAFPTIYFLDPALFNHWLENPPYFIAIMAGLAFSAGSLGLLIADYFENKLLNVDKLPFPVGEVSYKLIAVQEDLKQTYQLIAGSLLSGLYSFVAYFLGLASKITLFPGFSVHGLRIAAIGVPTQEFPLLIAIGFIAGSMVVVPMAIGILAKILLLNPAHEYFFGYLNQSDFSFAFISGMVVYGALMSLLELPKFFKEIAKKARLLKDLQSSQTGSFDYRPWVIIVPIVIGFLSWFKFSLLSQLYLIVFTALCTYQLLVIGGEIGLAPVARFATFVMVPAMFIFNPDYVQLTIISTFVEVSGGVGVDILFGRKLAQLSEVTTTQVRRFQWLGLCVSSVVVGVVFWVLITKLGLGTESLLAQRSQTRALTIQFQNFDFYAMTFGALFGSILKDFKVSPIMVLGGILMPMEWAFSLVAGGALASCMSNAKEYQSFWSGVFAINSIIMIIKALV